MSGAWKPGVTEIQRCFCSFRGARLVGWESASRKVCEKNGSCLTKRNGRRNKKLKITDVYVLYHKTSLSHRSGRPHRRPVRRRLFPKQNISIKRWTTPVIWTTLISTMMMRRRKSRMKTFTSPIPVLRPTMLNSLGNRHPRPASITKACWTRMTAISWLKSRTVTHKPSVWTSQSSKVTVLLVYVIWAILSIWSMN